MTCVVACVPGGAPSASPDATAVDVDEPPQISLVGSVPTQAERSATNHPEAVRCGALGYSCRSARHQIGPGGYDLCCMGRVTGPHWRVAGDGDCVRPTGGGPVVKGLAT